MPRLHGRTVEVSGLDPCYGWEVYLLTDKDQNRIVWKYRKNKFTGEWDKQRGGRTCVTKENVSETAARQHIEDWVVSKKVAQ